MNPLKSGDEPLEQAVASFLRNALANRYALENIRRYRAFDGLPDENIIALHEFGLRHIYPAREERRFQDQAFDALLALLDNPLRLAPLTAAALKSLVRFGSHLPKAVDAGKQVIAAFEATRTLEQELLDQIRTQKPPSLKEEDILQCASAAFIAMGKKRYERYIENVVSLMELLTQRRLLNTGASVLGDIATAMEKRPAVYTEIERAGMHYAVDVMSEGMALFDALDLQAVEEALGAIPEVERDWFDRICRITAP